MCLANHELARLRATVSTKENGPWHEFADHLAASAEAVMEGAIGSNFAGNTIAILREGVQVPVDEEHIDKLTEKIQRHIKVARALRVFELPTEPVNVRNTR